MSVHDAETVIDLPEQSGAAQPVPGHPHQRAGHDSDDDGAEAVDKAGGGGDGYQPRDHAVDATQQGGFTLAAREDVPDYPGQQRHGGGQVSVQNGQGGVGAGEVGVTAVEPVPAQPQDARPNRGNRQVVGHGAFAVAGQSGPDHRGCDKPAGAGGQVNYVSAGVVQRSGAKEATDAGVRLGPKAPAPH